MFDPLAAMFHTLDLATVVFVVTVFLLAGIIKGSVGFGMPLFAITALAFTMPLSAAIATNVAPSLISNVFQAFRGPYLVVLLKRLWPFLVPAIALIWLGIVIQVQINLAYPGLMLGILAILFAAVSFSKLQLSVRPEQEKPVGFILGAFNGILAGVTGIFIILSGLYLQALGLKRDELVQALGLVFMLSTAAIGIIFTAKAIMTSSLAVLSVLAVPAALIGMRLGEGLRKRLSEELFRRLFLAGIALIGLSLVVRNTAALLGA